MRKNINISIFFFIMMIVSYSSQGGANFTEINDATSDRQREVLTDMLRSPYPNSGMWKYEDFAMAAYWLNRERSSADYGIIKARNELFQGVLEGESFHWHAYILERLYFLFSSGSKYFPGRMSPEAEEAILEMLWIWSEKYCRIEMTLPERVWWIWGSENHHIQAWVSFVINKKGDYFLEATNEAGCAYRSDTAFYTLTSLDINGFEKFTCSIHPNPNKGIFKLKFNSNPRQKVSLKLIDSLGQIIVQREIKNPVINQTEHFNVSYLSRGVYHLIIKDEKNTSSQKIIKL